MEKLPLKFLVWLKLFIYYTPETKKSQNSKPPADHIRVLGHKGKILIEYLALPAAREYQTSHGQRYEATPGVVWRGRCKSSMLLR